MITVHADIERMAAHALAQGADAREIEHFKQIATAYLGPNPDAPQPIPSGQIEYLGIAAMVKYYDAIVKAKDAKIAALSDPDSVLAQVNANNVTLKEQLDAANRTNNELHTALEQIHQLAGNIRSLSAF